MAVKLELTGESPGYGRLVIRNFAGEGELQFCFQRPLAPQYLGPDQQWQKTEHWHRVGGVAAERNDCSCQIGPDIIDGLLLSSGGNLRVSVQGDGNNAMGMMRIMNRLLGSDAAGSSPQTRSSSRADAGQLGPETVVEVTETAEETASPDPLAGTAALIPGEASVPTEAPPPEEAPGSIPHTGSAAGSGKRGLWGLLAVLVLLVVLAAAWYFGLFKLPGLPVGDGSTVDPVIAEEPLGGEDAEEAPVVENKEEALAGNEEPPTTAVSLKGRPRAQAYLAADERPAPQAMFDQAAAWESEDDCEAAMIVYQIAAQADADQAARYARSYDPDGFKSSGCIGSPDAETAAYWYEGPAASGDVAAQRQLGKILVGKYSSGALREQGESWLLRAAQSGDTEAQALIERLGVGDN